jgi:hypothetical protein
MKKGFLVLLIFGFIVPAFGQETGFAYLDHLLVYETGKAFHVNRFYDDQSTSPFTDKNDRVYTYGIGMWSDNGAESGVGYAEYQISGEYSLFEATLALDKRWLVYQGRDMGTTRFILYADGTEIYNVKMNSSSEPIDISVIIPEGTMLLRLEVEQISGPGGTHGAIWGHAILRK